MNDRTEPWWLPVMLLLGFFLLTDSAHAQGKLEARAPDGAAVKLDLAEERLQITVDAQHARTTLKQTWNNPSSSRVEGSYRLQTGESSTVAGFSYWNGETKIVGEVFEREDAREIYDDVTGMGNDPGLLEQDAEGTFSFKVFPIEPGERKRVEVVHDRWMARAGRWFTYRARLGRPTAQLEVSIASPKTVSTITSPTHEITWSGKNVKVGPRIDAGHDFIVQIQHADPTLALSGAVHRNAGQDAYVVISVAAPTNVTSPQIVEKDVTLVIDRSGSMSGEPLRNAKAAAADVVARLPATDRVNVVVFDDGVDWLFPRPKEITDEVRAQVLAHVDRIRDGGGTDIAGALGRALGLQNRDRRPNIIVFLTDGQSDAQAALKVARADAGDTRVFTVGVGTGVDKPLLSRLAGEKRGRFTFVSDAAAIEPAMNKLYDRIAAPVVVNLSLDGGDGRLQRVYPKTLPDLFRGDEIKVVARVQGEGPLNLTLRGQRGRDELAMKTTLAVPTQTIRPWVGRQWAMTRVDDLLEEIALQGENDELHTEVLELSLAYELVGPYTSFLAIPESELTESASGVLANARARKEAILRANQDALALSRRIMPPGDPVLKVKAPRNAKQVLARFSFGEVHDLQWDPDAEGWTTRFLVPKGVRDGAYDVEITIVHADGRMEMGTTAYTIDSEAPQLEVTTQVDGDVVRVTVTANEALREVFLTDEDTPTLRVKLDATDDPKVFLTELLEDEAPVRIRVVATDRARNETVSTLRVGARR